MLVKYALKREVVIGERPIGVSVLGSTGSIGCSTLEVIRSNPELFQVTVLSANSNWELLLEQINEFKPRFAVLNDATAVKEILHSHTHSGTHVLEGEDALNDILFEDGSEITVIAIVGIAALRPLLAALKSKKRIALANKECVVAAGSLLKAAVEKYQGVIIPVDSEHSALFQVIQGESTADVSRLILTASGGPFYRTPVEKMATIQPAEAVKHPNWNMGAKISVDSATMVNKALELIEACRLFNLTEDRVDVLVHPQSIVHSLVAFNDGTQKAQLSVPSMTGPIAYALTYPHGRLPSAMAELNLAESGVLEFEALDNERFPAVQTARECLRASDGHCAVFNIANEVAVAAFLEGQLSFDRIVPFVRRAVSEFGDSFRVSSPESLDALWNETRERLFECSSF
ncbi:MAG: 1-deoxy-D-xylulose-5-phosphate reductoisomerase [Candidatus Dadabacteria bacterium]|nr:MAG: 1-deoxy-D-xylulose-5-phosphate reductoisomerase [Candidatus Dadabacteria bacterium]